MRNFEERKAEVFRRSENRIKERKRNRNRILALCIPLCLILTVWSVMILPAMLPAGKDAGAEQEMEFNGSINDSDGAEAKHIYVSVDVKSNDDTVAFHSIITNASGVTNVYENIFHAFEDNDSGNDMIEMPDQDGSIGDELKDYDSATKEHQSYTITMTAADGTDRIYILDGNMLCDISLDVEIKLDERQLIDLKAALGLTD